MTDRVVGTVGDPVLASLLLAKLAQAQERGVLLTLELGSEALNTRLPAQDVRLIRWPIRAPLRLPITGRSISVTRSSIARPTAPWSLCSRDAPPA